MFHKGGGLRPVTRAKNFRQRQIYQLTQEVCDVAHLVRFGMQTLNDVVRRRLERAIRIDDLCLMYFEAVWWEMSLTIDGSKDRNKAL